MGILIGCFSPSLQCPNTNDAFTVNATNGNGALDYPVGLLTEDELTLAGHGYSGYSTSSYLYTSLYSWSLSPHYFYHVLAYGFFWYSYSNSSSVQVTHAVRPVVSLTPGTAVSDGDGSANTPWVIEFAITLIIMAPASMNRKEKEYIFSSLPWSVLHKTLLPITVSTCL